MMSALSVREVQGAQDLQDQQADDDRQVAPVGLELLAQEVDHWPTLRPGPAHAHEGRGVDGPPHRGPPTAHDGHGVEGVDTVLAANRAPQAPFGP